LKLCTRDYVERLPTMQTSNSIAVHSVTISARSTQCSPHIPL